MYAIMLTQAQPGTAREAGSGNATGRRQYRPIVIRHDIDKTTPLLDMSTLGGDILAAVEQSIINTTKSNVKRALNDPSLTDRFACAASRTL